RHTRFCRDWSSDVCSSDLVRTAVSDGVIDGVTVRLESDEDMVLAADRIHAFADASSADILVSVKLAGPSIARERADDPDNMASISEDRRVGTETRKTESVH